MFKTKTFLMSQPTISNDLCRKTLLSRFLIILTSQFTAQAIASKVERYSFHAIIVPTKRWLLYLGPLLTYTHTHTQTHTLSLSLYLWHALALSHTLTPEKYSLNSYRYLHMKKENELSPNFAYRTIFYLLRTKLLVIPIKGKKMPQDAQKPG